MGQRSGACPHIVLLTCTWLLPASGGVRVCARTLSRGKTSTKIPPRFLPWLSSILYSLKVIKVSVWIKKEVGGLSLGPFLLLPVLLLRRR